MSANLTTLIAFIGFVILFLSIGRFAASKAKSTESDYLLGSRSFGPWMVGLSAAATANSGFIMIAAVGFGYTNGISALWMAISFFIGEIIFWTFFPDKINKSAGEHNAHTVPEFIGSVQKKRSYLPATSLAALITVIFVGAYACGQLASAAKTLDVFFGLDAKWGIIITAIIILSYCFKGGLRASIWTDFVQAIIMLITTVSAALVVLITVGGPIAGLEALAAIDPKLTDFFSMFDGFSGGVLYVVAFAFLGFGFDFSQPHLLIRLFAGKDPKNCKKCP